MGVEYYNQSANSGLGNLTTIYTPKMLHFQNQLAPLGWPVWRSGASDKYFKSTAVWVNDTGIELHSYTSSTDTLVASIGYQTATSSPTGSTYSVAYHMNSADQCMYALIYYNSGGGFWRLIKISDTTGVVTTIGAYFTPTTQTNWPGGGTKADMSVDTVSGHIKIVYNGVYHLLNKTTGAIVSQDTALVIGSYYTKGVNYVTADGTIGVRGGGYTVSADTSNVFTNYLLSASFGMIRPTMFSSAVCQIPWKTVTGSPVQQVSMFHTIDSDKIVIYNTNDGASGYSTIAFVFLRTEYDKLLKSFHDTITAV